MTVLAIETYIYLGLNSQLGTSTCAFSKYILRSNSTMFRSQKTSCLCYASKNNKNQENFGVGHQKTWYWSIHAVNNKIY